LPGIDVAELRDPLEKIMREAGELARATARGDFKRWTTGDDKSPVSDGDIAVNNLLRERLGALAPRAGWVSEETADPAASQDLAWIVDPIDGTRAYILGRPDWTISVCLAAHGEPVLAALFAPVTDEMFLAVRGGGATCNGKAIAAGQGNSLAGARLAAPKRYLDAVAAVDPGIVPQPKIFSLALRLTRVAHGALEGALASSGSHDWDLAAADLIVHEAGGLLTDFNGARLRYNRPQAAHNALIAADPGRHAILLEMVQNRQAAFA
jgi:myo-inositol-1(or 4)-monophosphatase